MHEPEHPVCAACGETVTDDKVTPADEVVVQAEMAAHGIEELLWVCDRCYDLMRKLQESDGD